MGTAAGQTFLQLIQLPFRSVETHRRVGGQLLLGAGARPHVTSARDARTRELCGTLAPPRLAEALARGGSEEQKCSKNPLERT